MSNDLLTRHPSYAASFAMGLMDPTHDAPDGVMARAGKGVVRRYNVYRNNVIVSLIDTLATIYPAVQRITGAEFFRTMARFHVRAMPPTSPLLFEYGREFPDFIESYEYARDMPWLADTARIERAWLDAYHAAEAPVLEADALTTVDPAMLATLHFSPHPAVRVLRSKYPAVAIFTMNKAEGPVSPLCSNDAEDALITRPDADVIVSRLPVGGAVFLMSLIQGATLGAAATAAFAESPSFDLAANLGGMMSAGVFSTIHDGA